jgi:hypothetical protein
LDIPLHRAPSLEASLETAGLLLCFECNRQDFINEAGLVFAGCMKDPILKEALSPPGIGENSGFAYFANAIWLSFTQAVRSSRASTSRTNPPIFSVFLLTRLQIADWQRFMTKDGKVKYKVARELLTQFSWYVALKACESGIERWQDNEIAKAKKQRQELVDEKRKLFCSSF